MAPIFDEWSSQYDQWFQTPVGRLVLGYETSLVLELLEPQPGERILDAGCGTGIFTGEILTAGARVVGLELSGPMLAVARAKLAERPFVPLRGDITRLPFADQVFDKTVSITALEFIPQGDQAVSELLRVTRPGGLVVVATLNRLSPWAERRSKAAQEGHELFKHALFRSPAELAALSPLPAKIQTAIHFPKDGEVAQAPELEHQGRSQGWETGAMVAARWHKPVSSG